MYSQCARLVSFTGSCPVEGAKRVGVDTSSQASPHVESSLLSEYTLCVPHRQEGTRPHRNLPSCDAQFTQ